MKVAMLGSLRPLRGISAFCQPLAESVSRLVPVEFVSFKAMYPRFLYPGDSLTDETAPLPAGPNLTVRRTLAWYNPFGWAFEGLRVRADVVHAQHWSLPLVPVYLTVLALARLRGARIVLTIHNTAPHTRSWAFVPALRALARLAHCCVLHSEYGREQAVELLGIPPGRVRVIALGAWSGVPAPAADRAAARVRLGLPDGAPVVLCFGALRPYKGVDVLMRAFAQALAAVPEARLVVAGKPWTDWAPYQALAEELGISGRLHAFPRFIPEAEVADFFAAADLVVLPYAQFDAQSGVGMVALGYGKPLLVTRVGGLPELVSDPRFVVEPNDAAMLADRLALCLREPGVLERMQADAAERARAFSWERVAVATVSLYEELCRPASSRSQG